MGNSRTNHGLHILRILSMLGIIGLHVLNAGGAMDRTQLLSPRNLVFSCVYLLCACSVNTFAMMTGYLYADRETVRHQNLLRLLATTLFYCIAITICVYLLDKTPFAQTPVLTSLYPFRANRYWYIACYTLLFLMIPYLNTMLRHLSDRKLGILALTLLIMTSLLPTWQRLDLFRLERGYSSAWLMVCYILGVYVKRRGSALTIGKSIAAMLLIAAAILGYSFYRFRFHREADTYKWLTEYICPGIVLFSMLSLNLFSRISLKEGILTKILASVSLAAFDVYILHSHILIYDNWITGGFTFLQQVGVGLLIPAFLGSLLAVYLAGWVTCQIRTGLFRLTGTDKLLTKLGRTIDKKIEDPLCVEVVS